MDFEKNEIKTHNDEMIRKAKQMEIEKADLKYEILKNEKNKLETQYKQQIENMEQKHKVWVFCFVFVFVFWKHTMQKQRNTTHTHTHTHTNYILFIVCYFKIISQTQSSIIAEQKQKMVEFERHRMANERKYIGDIKQLITLNDVCVYLFVCLFVCLCFCFLFLET